MWGKKQLQGEKNALKRSSNSWSCVNLQDWSVKSECWSLWWHNIDQAAF